MRHDVNAMCWPIDRIVFFSVSFEIQNAIDSWLTQTEIETLYAIYTLLNRL